MTTQARLNKDTVQLIKIAHRIEFVRRQNESGVQKVIAMIYLSEHSNPIRAMSGDGRSWDAHDILKAKRSIRRHNQDCLIIDRRDILIN